MASGLFSTPTEGGQPPQSLVEFPDNRLLIDLCGEFDRNLADIEQKMAVQIIRRGNELVVFGEEEARENALRLLDATRDGDGVKIFIGAENNLFASTGCSLVIAPYRNSDRSIIGAIGVLGPRHMNYARIIPMVDYTSKAIDRVLGR